MDIISCGIRWGLWVHYGNDISRLSNEIILEEMQDDFVMRNGFADHFSSPILFNNLINLGSERIGSNTGSTLAQVISQSCCS